MADSDKPPGAAHAAGAGILALLGGLATFADDCARSGALVAGSADDLARVGTLADDVAVLGSQADDVGRLGTVGDDVARLGTGADEAARLGTLAPHLDDGAQLSDDLGAELLVDLGELGLDAADLLLDASEGGPTPKTEPARPRLVVASMPNPPATGPVDPLVLLVRDDDAGRLERLARTCTTVEHRCIVLACPPAVPGCEDQWRMTWTTLVADPALVGHPEAFPTALAAVPSTRSTSGTRMYSGVFTPTGVTVEKRAIRE